MGYSGFGWLGVAYVALVPIPLYFFGAFVRKSHQDGTSGEVKPITIWTSPIPYLGALFVILIVVQIVF